MSNYAQAYTQFNVKVVGEERVKIVEAAREYCATKGITISEFVITALKNAVDHELLPENEKLTRAEVEMIVRDVIAPLIDRIVQLELLMNNSSYSTEVHSISNDEMLAFLIELREANRTNKGRIIGYCKSMVDEYILKLGGKPPTRGNKSKE